MYSKMAVITFFEQGERPGIDNSLPGGGFAGRPDNSLPGYGGPVDPGYGRPSWGGHPGNALPGGGHIALLPVFPFDPTRPDAGLPGDQPGVDNSLPGGGHVSGQPIVPGRKFVVKWLACTGLILVPDNELPPAPEPK